MLRILTGNPAEFADYIKRNNSRLYLWGSGVMLHTCLREILTEHDLLGAVVSCTESDRGKIGRYLLLGDRRVPVVGAEEMAIRIAGDSRGVIVVTCSYYYEILREMDGMERLDQRTCILLPMLYLENLAETEKISSPFGQRLIPPKIHYCWFGDSPMPEKSLNCMESWKRQCPGYEIVRWDESNVDLEKSPWLSQAYKKRQWAFVSDYVRAEVLYTQGGFYFDTDVELVKGLEDLAGLEAFGCFEKWPVINTGGGCGSAPFFWLWREVMELKDSSAGAKTDLVIPSSSGYFDTLPLVKKGLRADGRMQEIDGFTVLPAEYFHPFDYVSRRMDITDNTHGIHYFNWSWADSAMLAGNPQEKNYYVSSLERAARIRD